MCLHTYGRWQMVERGESKLFWKIKSSKFHRLNVFSGWATHLVPWMLLYLIVACIHDKLLQSCLIVCHPMDCSPAGCPVHGILQAGILEWVDNSFSRGSSWPRDKIQVSWQILYHLSHQGSPIVAFSLLNWKFSSVLFSSVTQLCLTLWDPINRSTPGLPVHHQLPEFTQTHAHRVDDAIQPSHPLSSPSLPAPNPSQHQGLFQWVNSLHEVAKVLEFQLQHQSIQWTPRTDLL